MSPLVYHRGTLAVLWRRDLLLFFRQPSRLAGALLTPLLLWLAIGAGIAPSFKMRAGETGYMEYFYPGVIFPMLPQVSISATMSVIEDRSQGFLQRVLVAPGSRSAVALGKICGSATVALLHASLFALLAPLAGFPYGEIAWIRLATMAGLVALTLTALEFVLAWMLDSIQGLPHRNEPSAVPALDPLRRDVPAGRPPSRAGVDRALEPAQLRHVRDASRALRGVPAGRRRDAGATPPLELGVLAATTIALLLLACRVASRRSR